MSFLNQFASHFTQEEQQTELYNLWSSIGVNTEKAILEEQTKLNNQLSDISFFSENTLRSWLSFFLQKIPYRTSAVSQLTVKLGSSYSQTTIPKGSTLVTSDGIIYTQMEDITLTGGATRKFNVVQGNLITENISSYNNLIKITASNPDLSQITVKLNGVEIPPVSYDTTYDKLNFIGSWKPENESGKTFGGTPQLNNSDGTKGYFYTVTNSGKAKFSSNGTEISFEIGDIVVFDGISWVLLSKRNNLSPIQFATSTAVPKNGYYAYFYDNSLYIKIFPGNDVENPEGGTVEITYISSDGIQGEISKNTLSYTSDFTDEYSNSVELEVSNDESTNGINEPSVGKLSLLLKEKLYASSSISSVPEYTSWFNSQPEVGDCIVMSDYERSLRTGYLEVTGTITAYLIDNNGNQLTDSIRQILQNRLSPKKDIGLVEFGLFDEIKNHFEFSYQSSSNNTQFNSTIVSRTKLFYDISYLHSKNSSLFESLDLAKVIKDIQDNCSIDSVGLTVKAYHVYEESAENINTFTVDKGWTGESVGDGWYELYFDGETTPVKLTENLTTISGHAYIYKENDSANSVGNHTGTSVSINLSNIRQTFETVTIKCFWGMSQQGVLDIGSVNGLRKFDSICINGVEQ